jgi:hypothetical protein
VKNTEKTRHICPHCSYELKIEASQRPVSDEVAEFLHECSLPPYKDSDLRALFDWINKRASEILAQLKLTEAKPAVTEDILETEAMRSVVAVARMIQNQKPDARMHHQLKRLDEIRSRKLRGEGK